MSDGNLHAHTVDRRFGNVVGKVYNFIGELGYLV